MKIKFLFFILLLTFSKSVLAQFDLSYGFSGRSYPSLGGGLFLESGYNQVLYGSAGDSAVFGLIRPSIKANTSVVVSNYDARVTLYPISFIGIGAGQKKHTSEYEEFDYFDCDEIRCTGTITRDYSFGKLAFGLGNIVTSFSYMEQRNTYGIEEDETDLVAEYEDAVEVSPKNETATKRSYFLGYKLGKDTAGVISTQTKYHDSQKETQNNFAFYHLSLENKRLLFGLGSFHSTDVKPNPIFIFRFTHILLPSLAIF